MLVTDDAASMRMMVRDFLTKGGYEVISEASNGLEAVEQYRVHKPDIVHMDITMPDMEGIQALREIKGVFLKQEL